MPRPTYVYAPCFDYATLTTRRRDVYSELIGACYAAGGVPEEGVFGTEQYTGSRGDGFFWGEGVQNGQPHYLIRTSGSFAHDFVMACVERGAPLYECNVTRVDLQVTADNPRIAKLSEVGEALRAAPPEQWGGKGRRPKVRYYSDEDDAPDTLYIGSRKSLVMRRIYEKPVDDEDMLRFEVEYKGEAAARVLYDVVRYNERRIATHLMGEYAKLPAPARVAWGPVMEYCKGHAQKVKVRARDHDSERTIRWLWASVLPALHRLAKAGEDDRLAEFMYQASEIVAGVSYHRNCSVKFYESSQVLQSSMEV